MPVYAKSIKKNESIITQSVAINLFMSVWVCVCVCVCLSLSHPSPSPSLSSPSHAMSLRPWCHPELPGSKYSMSEHQYVVEGLSAREVLAATISGSSKVCGKVDLHTHPGTHGILAAYSSLTVPEVPKA